MGYQVRTLRAMEEAEWDRFVREATGGTLFASSRWMRLLCRATAGSYELIGCFHQDRLVGGVPLYFPPMRAPATLLSFERMGSPAPTRPPLTPYQGPLWLERNVADLSRAEHHRHELLEALHAWLAPRYDRIELSASPDLTDPRPLLWAGWQAVPRYTYQLELESREEVARGRTHALRKQIAKCEREGVQIDAKASIPELYQLWSLTFQRQHLPVPLSMSGLETLLTPLMADGTAELAMARRAGDPLAFNICLHDGATSYDWIAGSSPSGLQLGAPSLAKWHLIEACIGTRLLYDLVGANVQSIAHYKAGFGAKLVTHLWLNRVQPRRPAGFDRVRWLITRFSQPGADDPPQPPQTEVT